MNTKNKFHPLPLGTLLLIQKLAERLDFNEAGMKRNPLNEFARVTHENINVVRGIVALLFTQGDTEAQKVRGIYNDLKECGEKKLTSFLIAGLSANLHWLREAGLSVSTNLSSMSHKEFFEEPFVSLLKEKYNGRNTF